MHAATIVPQTYLHLTEDQPYHLALAHLIHKEGFNNYSNFYRSIGQAEGKFLILDNGLIEGDPRPIEELVDKAQWLEADELVLPDVYQNRMATLRASYDALEFVRRVAPGLRVMCVPQGETFEQWHECALEMISWGIDTLSVPKVVTKMAGRDGRLRALEILQPELKKHKLDVHLLGCWESPLELKVIENYIRSGEILPVRGVDSAIAYIYARAGLKMCDGPRPEGAVDFDAFDADEDILVFNIQMWQEECAALPPLGDAASQVRRIYR